MYASLEMMFLSGKKDEKISGQNISNICFVLRFFMKSFNNSHIAKMTQVSHFPSNNNMELLYIPKKQHKWQG